MLHILICDDNKKELSDITANFISYFDAKNNSGDELMKPVLHSFDNSPSALDFAQNNHRIDIAVLDIMMPEINGIELAEKLRALEYTGYIVFLTTVNDFAAEAFGIRAFDYLLKPAGLSAITKLMDRLLKDYADNDNKNFNIKIKTDIRQIKFRELKYVEVSNNNLYFYTCGKKTIKAYATLKEYADIILNDKRMIRANHSYIINIDYIRSFARQAVVMQDDTRISVTGSFRDFKNYCYEHMFGGCESEM